LASRVAASDPAACGQVDIEHVSAEAILAMKNLLRKFPERIERFIGGVGAFFRTIDDADAKVALLWMVAEYGHVIPEARRRRPPAPAC